MADPSEPACYHCGQPVPPGLDCRVQIDGESRPMCCPGCQAVAQAIVDAGLTDFYRYRTEPPGTAAELVPEILREHQLYDRDDLQRSFVRGTGGQQREASLILEGIVCAACVWLNERHVARLPGVLEFRVNYSTHRARLRWDNDRIRLSEILDAIAAIGYQAHPFDPGRQEALQRRERAAALRRIAVAGLGAMQVMMIAVALYAGDYYGMETDLRGFMRWVSLVIATPVVLYAARPFFQGAWRDLSKRRLGMDVPVALAIGAAYAASAWATVTASGEVYFDSVTMFAFFLLVGRYLEMMARHKAGQAAEELVRLTPATATRLDAEDRPQSVAVADLDRGDRVLIKPGETVPADGTVLEGRSSVNEALLTGESLPSHRGPGDVLVGGSLNVESPLVMRVDQVGQDTVLAAIVRLLERAQTEKPALARLADRVAAWFVAAILVVAVSVYAFWLGRAPEDAFWIMLSVLVVTCPCALSLATPAAITAATGTLTRLGVLTTRGHALETLARASDIVFDKTGTLTYGRLELVELEPLGKLDRTACLRLAAGLEAGSEHPIARAIAESVERPESVSDLRSVAGEGVEGRHGGRRYRLGRPQFVAGPRPELLTDGEPGETQVVLGDDSGILALLRFRDRLRPEAAEIVHRLRGLGLEVSLLSGDAEPVVSKTAERLGIGRAEGRLLPGDKLARLRALESEGRIVAMIGDGVNDAPVLAGAPVSIAMGGGAQLAHASADMVLLSENLDHLVQAVQMARRTLTVIRQNFAWALTYNVIALPLAAAGLVAPWMAALGMSASSLIVVVNALRLREPAGRERRGRAAAPGLGADSPR
jgi:Cu2+-exporting ATPase